MVKRKLSFEFKLNEMDLSNAKKIERIKSHIANLKLSIESFVVVHLPPPAPLPASYKYIEFFQTKRHRSFKQTNYYFYEIMINTASSHGTK